MESTVKPACTSALRSLNTTETANIVFLSFNTMKYLKENTMREVEDWTSATSIKILGLTYHFIEAAEIILSFHSAYTTLSKPPE